MPRISLKFIDLFAGLGGFHVALKRLGHECVFSSEIQPELRELYNKNFGINAEGDLRQIDISDIPDHDILCAGFPCQPFSKAGEQQGLDCPKWGDLIDYVITTLEVRRPTYFILENVANIMKHDGKRTWRTILSRLRLAGYTVDACKLSPHEFGIPQIRERVFIVGSRIGLANFTWPAPLNVPTDIRSVLDSHPKEATPVSDHIEAIGVWQEFLHLYPKSRRLPWFPIWAMEFGATYPFENSSPYHVGNEALGEFKGCFGDPLSNIPTDGRLLALPSYAQTKEAKFPSWKVGFIRQNRELYRENKVWIDKWMLTLRNFAPSFQKFEWNCLDLERDIYKYVLQLRGSGIRVKRTNTAPALVAMSSSQVPVVGWEGRYMTVRECARLQGIDELEHLPNSKTGAFRALGNAVNADLVEMVAHELLAITKSVQAPTVRRLSTDQLVQPVLVL